MPLVPGGFRDLRVFVVKSVFCLAVGCALTADWNNNNHNNYNNMSLTWVTRMGLVEPVAHVLVAQLARLRTFMRDHD